MTDPSEKLDPMSLLTYMSGVSIALLLPMTWILEPGAFTLAASVYASNGHFAWWLLVNASLAFLANLLNFLVTFFTSALTLQVLGNAKGVVAAFVSVLLFKNPVTAQGGRKRERGSGGRGWKGAAAAAGFFVGCIGACKRGCGSGRPALPSSSPQVLNACLALVNACAQASSAMRSQWRGWCCTAKQRRGPRSTKGRAGKGRGTQGVQVPSWASSTRSRAALPPSRLACLSPLVQLAPQLPGRTLPSAVKGSLCPQGRRRGCELVFYCLSFAQRPWLEPRWLRAVIGVVQGVGRPV